jgi:ABC-type transport system involved in multi-copper enzyme maturation permease subunit
MRSRFPVLLRNEISKALRRKLPYFGLLVVAVLCALVYFVAGQLSTAATTNAWGYAAFSMQLVFNDIGPIFIIVFSALAVAEETGTGTIRTALAAPVQRWELYSAKAVVSLLHMMVLSATALVFSLAIARIHFQFGAVGDAYGVVYTRGHVAQAFALGYVLSWIPLGALAMYGLFISTVVRNPGAAVAVGIGLFFLIEFTKHLVGLDPYLFTRYLEYSWLVLQLAAQGMDYHWQPEVWKMAGLSGASALVTFAAGLIIFVRQDLNK